MSPLERPDAGLVAALGDAGALGVLDLGRDRVAAAHAVAALCRRSSAPFGVRVPVGVEVELPAQVHVVIVETAGEVARFLPRFVLAQVTSLDEARAAIAAGAGGLIAKGGEAGGRVGEETTFVLLQRLLAACNLPVWAQGGIGTHTAAACIAGGAAGVVLDTQLALLRESTLPADIQAAIAAMDGSETTLIAGHRVYTRPDLPVAGLAGLDVDGVRARLGGDDLARNLLPIGQDGAFAKAFAQRLPTAAQLVRGLRAEIASHLAAAAEHQPLAPNAPLAQAHGTTYPITQGPMSRVSDRARFADAVSRAGGLPFLALTLMTGAEVRELLRETQALLGHRPWGVGILGFVPPEVREQQLAVLREIPPPVALIAGGRPSQAHPLEAQGTLTYLHVPSPGLLDLFLRDGARKFVFEGRECGGHVGPRSSFALWEAQLERLLAHPAAHELSILFAGGIHDARSAAMVAAMAAPLAAKGARIGVLMGTAYLFTQEAVDAGAIEPGFQREAVACERTVLLETAPGHSTRCADTAFAAQFAEEKRRLEAAGVPAQEIWATLEQLNLGRLRIAAKGLRRDGARIETVPDEVQQREGMYMIGQVAALRASVCTMAELHADVSQRGAQLVADAAARENAPDERSSGTDIAVIGVAAMFPGAPDTHAFWANIVAGKSAIREVPPERWSVETYYDPKATGADVGGKTPCKWGGFLDDIPFDPLAYGIPPKSLSAIEPVQLLSLEIAKRALTDAGYTDGGRNFDRERTSVIFGAEAGTDLSSAYSFRALFPHYVGPLPAGLDAQLPTLSEDSFPGVLSNVIAGRIANRLDLGGVNYTVDAACAASLAAVDMAVKELVAGSSDMVLCGGADLHNSINDYLMFSSVHALSPTGQCHTFDADADGIVLGEGVACVVLKRLADAERDGDRVYAVIKGVAGASDGKSLGLTAPRKDGQVRALERAYKVANVSPADVGLVEAHGTGTVVGDKTELATLTEVYRRAGAAAGSCVLGSVKSQIGHTKCAAGMAGLIKAALAIHHGVLPPTLNIKKPNSAWNPDDSPFVFLDQARPWPSEERVAAVSAFGFGGTNFHAVLAAHRGAQSNKPTPGWPAELLLFRGADREAALAVVERVARGAARPDARLRDLARTACATGSGPVQIAVVAESVDDLRAKLDAARAGNSERGVFARQPIEGSVAFLCPGQGSQRPGMLAELFVAFPRLHRLLALGEKWARTMFPRTAFTRDERAAQQAALTDTRVAQPALGIADLAVAELMQLAGVKPAMAAGHSYGELAALCIAGAIGEADLLALSEARGEHILAAAGSDPGTMAAVAADAAVVGPILAGMTDGVVIANHNSPKQCVLSGSTQAIETALGLVAAAGLTAKRIPVACAFHSPIVAGARDALAQRLAAMPIAAPKLPVFSNVTAEPYPADADGVRDLVAAQVAKPVRFAHEIEAMYAAGARVFVETGPGQVLTRLVDEILGDRPHVAVACDTGDASLRQLLRALAALAAAGVEVDPAPLFWDRDASILDLGVEKARSATMWLVNGHSARPANGGPIVAKPAVTAAIAKPMTAKLAVASAPAQAPMPVASEREAVVVEYLRNMRSMIAAQRDVMLSYLGAAPRVVEEIYVPPAVIEVATTEELAMPMPEPVQQPAVIDPAQLVIAIVSERTGYPADTLGMDLDLEADLSIDSIKRIEIIGELATRLGLRVENGAQDADAIVEELAGRKTLRSLIAWLTDRLAKDAAGTTTNGSADAAPPTPEPATTGTAPTPPTRYAVELVEAPLPINGHSTFAGKRVAIRGERGAAAVARLLEAEGATVRRLAPSEAIGEIDGFVETDGLVDAADPVAALRATFEHVREALLAGAKTLLVATGMGGRFGRDHASAAGRGIAGIIKTVAAEWPSVKARAVDLDPAADDEWLGARLHAELHAADEPVEIGYRGDARSTLAVIESPGSAGARSDAERRGESIETPQGRGALALPPEAVVLVTGGARGITALAAIELARRFRCTIELVGRSPLPGDEDPALAGDAATIRKAMLGRGMAPAEIERTIARTLGAREIRATLEAIRGAGATVAYHAVDVRDAAFGALIDDIYARHGRLDGVIHGAGVLEDKLIRDKTGDSFERVVSTKLGSALQLAAHLRPGTKFVTWFASISGVAGNRGQVDYAAANDALDKLAWSLRDKIARIVSIDWGPWAGAGMVTAELAREYARRGIGLIDPAAGVDALLAELAGAGDAQVVLTAAAPQSFRRNARAEASLTADA